MEDALLAVSWGIAGFTGLVFIVAAFGVVCVSIRQIVDVKDFVSFRWIAEMYREAFQRKGETSTGK